jgi:rhamnose transport system ATP-binding protein
LTTVSQNNKPAFECQGLRKEFPGVLALKDVSLAVGAGEIHALVGENGAGKSTLVKIIAGQLAPEAGTVCIQGTPITQFTPRKAREYGVTMVPQHPDLFHSLSALENLFVGAWPRGVARTVSWSQMRRQAQAVLEQMGISLNLNARVGEMTVAERQLLQIARALLADARLLILDEPTAPLGQDDTERLFALMRRLNQQGVSILYISHRLAEVFELAHQVTVLRDGAVVRSLPIDQVTRESLVAMMVGREGAEAEGPAKSLAGPEAAETQAALLQVENLAVRGHFADVSFSLQPGEILGIGGVAGSGRNEVLRALAGVVTPDEGAVSLDGHNLAGCSPGRVNAAGISFVPADRHHEALILPMSVRENITLGSLGRFVGALGLLDRRREDSRAQELFTQLDVRAAGLEQAVGSLSGGNQQKVALASRLLTTPRVLILEEPTQGVDVGARAEIHRGMRQLASQGVGILLVSSDLPELLSLSDRVLVMHRGRLVGEKRGAEATQEAVLDLALGTSEEGAQEVQVKPRKAPMRELGLVALLLVLLVGISLAAPTFAQPQNLADILVNNSHLLIAAVGMTLVILTAGIDISIGSVFAVAATLAATCAATGLPPIVVLAVSLTTGLLLGAINAGLITAAGVPPIIATLATLTLFRHVLIHFTRGKWINIPSDFRELGLSTPLGVPLPVWIALVAALAVAVMARWTALGRSIYAVGSHPEAAGHVGISVRGVNAFVYLMMGLLTGLAAFVFAARWSAVQTNAGNGMEMVVITAVVVGGTSVLGGSGTIGGTVLGVLLLGVIAGSLTHLHIAPTWERAFQGVLILGAVVVDALRSRRGGEAA